MVPTAACVLFCCAKQSNAVYKPCPAQWNATIGKVQDEREESGAQWTGGAAGWVGGHGRLVD